MQQQMRHAEHGLLSTALTMCGVCMQAASLPADLPTFFCCTPRLMSLAAIDPSLAVGFYCQNAGKQTAATACGTHAQSFAARALWLMRCLTQLEEVARMTQLHVHQYKSFCCVKWCLLRSPCSNMMHLTHRVCIISTSSSTPNLLLHGACCR
jgi:hypothetical protein